MSRRRGAATPFRPAAPPPARVEPEDVCEPEWAAWYRLSPAERWAESTRLWEVYLSLGGRLDPEPDTQSPFHDRGAGADERKGA